MTSTRTTTIIISLLLLSVPIFAILGSSVDTRGEGNGTVSWHADSVPDGYIGITSSEDLAKIGNQAGYGMDGKYILMNDISIGNVNGSYNDISSLTLRLRVINTSALTTMQFTFDDTPVSGSSMGYYSLDGKDPVSYTVYKNGSFNINSYDNSGQKHTLTIAGEMLGPGQTSGQGKKFVFTYEITAKLTTSAFTLDATKVQINVMNGNFSPIGNLTNPFTGIFNGNGYAISGLDIWAYKDCAGLFGYISDATIVNTTVSGRITSICPTTVASVDISYSCAAGGIAGVATMSHIDNCVNKVSISVQGLNGYVYAAGIVGAADSSYISNSRNEGTVIGYGMSDMYLNVFVGGITAYSIGQAPSRLTQIISCENDGELKIISRSTDSNSLCGGIAACMDIYSIISDSNNSGEITLSSKSVIEVGGIIGYGYISNISRSGNTGNISVTTNGSFVYVGGIAGDLDGYVTDCYNKGNVTVNSNTAPITGQYGVSVGGILGASSMTSYILRCYNEGNITVGKITFSNSNYKLSVHAGGIVGSTSAVTAPISFPAVQDSYNLGSVNVNWDSNSASTSRELSIGGIAGELTVASDTPSLLNCYNAGNISYTVMQTFTTHKGGIVGNVISSPLFLDTAIISCFYLNTMVQENSADSYSLALPLQDMKERTTFESKGWDFKNTWAVNADKTPEFKDVPDIDVTFDPMDGDPVKHMTIRKGDTIFSTFSDRSGYKFAGWFTDLNGNGIKYENGPINEDTAFYAYWIQEVPDVVPTPDNHGGNGTSHTEKWFPWIVLVMLISVALLAFYLYRREIQ